MSLFCFYPLVFLPEVVKYKNDNSTKDVKKAIENNEKYFLVGFMCVYIRNQDIFQRQTSKYNDMESFSEIAVNIVICVAALVVLQYIFTTDATLPVDCEDIQKRGFNATGVYVVTPEKTSGIRVRCDMETDGGGWTVIQRRVSKSDFYKTWNEYEIGFGDLDTNFWLGNLQIHKLTSQNWYKLRIDMTHSTGVSGYAVYEAFAVGNSVSKYQLLISGFHGTAGDAMTRHNGFPFTTKDKDHDIYSGNCATLYTGAWWYTNCHSSNLNGDYGNTNYAKGLTWRPMTSYYASLTSVEMKIKRFVPGDSGVEV